MRPASYVTRFVPPGQCARCRRRLYKDAGDIVQDDVPRLLVKTQPASPGILDSTKCGDDDKVDYCTRCAFVFGAFCDSFWTSEQATNEVAAYTKERGSGAGRWALADYTYQLEDAGVIGAEVGQRYFSATGTYGSNPPGPNRPGSAADGLAVVAARPEAAEAAGAASVHPAKARKRPVPPEPACAAAKSLRTEEIIEGAQARTPVEEKRIWEGRRGPP